FADAGAKWSGLVSVFDVNSGALLYTLNNPNPADEDGFGWSVGASADVIVVGTLKDDTVATDSGAAYVFDAGTGALLDMLTEPTQRAFAHFGTDVAVAAGKIVVGASGWGPSNLDTGGAFLCDAVAQFTIDENSSFTLSGTFHDDGTLDTHTVSIDWGGGGPGQPAEGTTTLTTSGPNPPGTTLISLGNGDWQFTAGHTYLDDNPTGTAGDNYLASVVVSDDDASSGMANTTVTVLNLFPAVTSLTPPTAINENDTFVLTGVFHDPGSLDTHTVMIDWGGG